MPSSRPSILLLPLLFLLLSQTLAQTLLGELSREAHDVRGTVYIINTRTLEIRNFFYDGLGPSAVFWVDKGNAATRSGVGTPVLPGCAVPPKLNFADGQTFRVEMPEGTTLTDWGYFSVWCRTASQVFGGIAIDSAKLSGVPEVPSVCSPPDAEVEIGPLSRKQHGVEGTVFAVNDRTLRIKGLRYDGLGPAAVFWTGTGEVNASGQRVPFRSNCTASTRLPLYTGQTVELELPDGKTLADVDYFSVWCEEASQDFGSVTIDAGSLSGVPQMPEPTCGGGGGGEEEDEPFPVDSGWNCEALADDFQVRWKLDGDNVDFELVGRIGTTRYMGFGPSGMDDRTDMDLSDVTIAYQNGDDFKAVDFHITSRQPCSEGKGVCPDEALLPTAGKDDNTEVSGKSEGDLTSIRYTRSLAAAESTFDRPISATGPTFISWATGPLNPSSFLPLCHAGQTNFPRGDVSIEFGRSATNECQKMLIMTEEDPIPGFIRPTISDTVNITARIGPPGGPRGVSGISQGPSWGFAWYMSPTGSTGEDVLIPAIAVERGKKYTFTVQGGIDDGTEKAFHPLYITDSAIGGYRVRTPKQRSEEKVFAGVEDIVLDEDGGVKNFTATATGALCEFTGSLRGDTAEVQTWEEYAKTLNTSCTQNETIQSNSGILEWTVPQDAPDLLYYQCITHPFLGYKLVVFDEGEVDRSRLQAASGGAELNAPQDCKVTFKGEEKTFRGCRKQLSAGVEVYWTLNEAEGEIETLFRAPTRGGYVGFGWGYRSMVGSNVVIAFQDSTGEAAIDDYFLSARSSSGVQPAGNQKLVGMDAAIDGDFVAGIFTRKLEVADLPTIENGKTGAIWAIGDKPSSKTTLTQHIEQADGEIDISLTTGTATFGSRGLLSEAYFIAHAVLMILAWLVLTPIAVLAMKHLKGYNPITFQAHRGLNTLSVVLILIAYIMALVRGSRSEKVHLGLGSTAFTLALLQIGGGILRPHKGTSSRLPWYIGHASFGHVALLLAMANALVGMLLYDAGPGWIVVWGILVGAYFLAHIVLFFLKPKLPQEKAEIGEKGKVVEEDITEEEKMA